MLCSSLRAADPPARSLLSCILPDCRGPGSRLVYCCDELYLPLIVKGLSFLVSGESKRERDHIRSWRRVGVGEC